MLTFLDYIATVIVGSNLKYNVINDDLFEKRL